MLDYGVTENITLNRMHKKSRGHKTDPRQMGWGYADYDD